MTDPLKVEVVGPVITNTENPWRTQGDYREDQKRQIHLYYFQAATLLVAVAGLVASSWFQYQSSLQPLQKVEIQCIAKQPAESVADKSKGESPSQPLQQRKTQPRP